MRCSRAREKLAALNGEEELGAFPSLADHVGRCHGCGEAWRLHLRLLRELSEAPPAPLFGDLAPRVLAGLDSSRPALLYWRWAAAAAFIAATLLLGYLLGLQSSTPTARPEGSASTYIEALSASPYQPVEFASAQVPREPESVPARSGP